MKPYKDLEVWQKTMLLCTEAYALTSQMRRASLSIPSNTAEGQKRAYKKEFVQFLLVSYSYSAGLETQVELARRIGFVSHVQIAPLSQLNEDMLRMLSKLIQSLKSNNKQQSTINAYEN